jgi:acyl-CoA reductase-like NAD-dependent aldehyde dehydrogenase
MYRKAYAIRAVISLTPYEDIEDAVRMANDSEYSLIAGFWTSDLHEAMKYAPQLRAGSVQVNGSTIHIEPTFGNVSPASLPAPRNKR